MNAETPLYGLVIEVARKSATAALARTPAGRVHARGGVVNMAPEGFPDVSGFLMKGPRSGAFVAFECKSIGAKTEKNRNLLQLAWQASIRKAGGFCEVVTSPEQALRFLLQWTTEGA
jgi:hypothetical protein